MATTSKTEGIFVRENRTFYYLETGEVTPRSSLDRIRSMLLQRELISYHRKDPMDLEPDHKKMTLGEAQDAGITVQPIFLSKHIEEQFKNKKDTATTNPWKR